MATPEQKARQLIDAQLRAAGWAIQDRDEMSLGAGVGVAVREYPLAAGPCDYLLFVDRRACGVVEAKPEGKTLSGVAEQASGYQHRLPGHLASWGDPLRFDYEASGSETLFSDRADPEQRSRYVFNIHRPETLLEWLKDGSSLRARLTAMPALVTDGLRDCQIEAITALEASLAEAKPRALVQMTMGAGKTFTAATQSYRLLAHAGAKRVLFLVDRNNLGRQTLKEFQAYRPPGTGRLFTELYNVQRLGPAGLDADAKVVTGANVTKSGLVIDQLGQAFVSQHVGLVRPVDTGLSAFLYLWVIAYGGGRGYLEKAAYGAGKPGLNLQNLLEMPVALPPLDEQAFITQLAGSVRDRAQELALDFDTANLRQSILAAAFRGELVA